MRRGRHLVFGVLLEHADRQPAVRGLGSHGRAPCGGLERGIKLTELELNLGHQQQCIGAVGVGGEDALQLFLGLAEPLLAGLGPQGTRLIEDGDGLGR